MMIQFRLTSKIFHDIFCSKIKSRYFDLTSFMELPITEKLPNKDFKRNYKEIKKFYSKLFESD